MNLYIKDLEEFIKKGKKIPDELNSIIYIFFTAIEDWPRPVASLEDYEFEVSKFIGRPADEKEIESTLKTIDLSTNAWEAESLSEIVKVFQFFKKNTSLKEIISELRLKLKYSEGKN